jgi:DNA repair exonuclease SbcCD ATPase subunit
MWYHQYNTKRKEGTGMDTVIQKFRTAFGGFNRQDVQQYIEQTAAAHRQELAQLQERLDQAEEKNAQLEAALSGAESEKSGAAAEEAKVRASLEASTRSLSKLRGELSQTESKLMVAKKELERLQTQVGTLEPMAESYAQLKDRVATVELDAHRRAQDTVSQAQEEAERIRADTQQWLDGVLEQYGQLRRGMDTLLEQAQALGRAAEQVGTLDKAAQGLREQGGLR